MHVRRVLCRVLNNGSTRNRLHGHQGLRYQLNMLDVVSVLHIDYGDLPIIVVGAADDFARGVDAFAGAVWRKWAVGGRPTFLFGLTLSCCVEDPWAPAA